MCKQLHERSGAGFWSLRQPMSRSSIQPSRPSSTKGQERSLLPPTPGCFRAELIGSCRLPRVMRCRLFTITPSPAAGQLIRYGRATAGLFHERGVYVGRILKGEKPGDLEMVSGLDM